MHELLMLGKNEMEERTKRWIHGVHLHLARLRWYLKGPLWLVGARSATNLGSCSVIEPRLRGGQDCREVKNHEGNRVIDNLAKFII